MRTFIMLTTELYIYAQAAWVVARGTRTLYAQAAWVVARGTRAVPHSVPYP